MADQFYGLTDTGRERSNNEDTFIAQQSANGKFIIACVIDGVGGYSGGEVAAALAREAILKRLDKPSGEIIPILIDCFYLANEQILQEKKQVKEHDSMACVATLALVDIEHNQFYYVHVGDTRLYLMRDDSLVKISRDQSFVGFLEDSGRLTEEAAMTHPKRNEINKALGFETGLSRDSDYLETGQSPFLPGDMLLLCSDGLTDMVGKSPMTEILSLTTSLKDKCRKLVDTANANGGKDNITVVLVQNSKQQQRHDATMPAANPQKGNSSDAKPAADKPRQTVNPALPPGTSTPGTAGTIIFLTVMMLIFLGTTVWQFVKNKPTQAPPKTKDSVVVKPRNKQELKLQAAINQAKNHVVILDTAYTSPIIISQAIQIGNDSLLIKAKGKMEFQSDLGYKGSAFNLTTKCRNVVLDSLVISGFQTGITAYNSALALKNTRFINCLIPLKNAYIIPDKKYVNGKMPVVFRADSLPVTVKHK